MKYLLMLLFTWMLSGFSFAEEPPVPDSIVLSEVLRHCISDCISDHLQLFTGKTAVLSFSPGIRLARQAQQEVEALLTTVGLAITRDAANPDFTFTLGLSDARIVVRRFGEGDVRRTVKMKVHLSCVDAAGLVVVATSREKILSDTFPLHFMGSTDDSNLFSRDITRYSLRKNRGRWWLASLVVFMGVLVYFAFE